MTRVLLIEDSVTARTHLSLVIRQSHELRIVALAGNASEAIAAARLHKPDIVSLDVFIPGASAAQLVTQLLAIAPFPIVLVSDAPRESTEVFDALKAGALDFVRKPAMGDHEAARRLIRTLQALSTAGKPRGLSSREAPRVILIGSSTGGPPVLNELFSALPAGFPLPIVVAQHIAEGFAEGLAAWLQGQAAIDIRVASDGSALQPGEALIGVPGRDLEVEADGTLSVMKAPAAGYHPSADRLFASAAEHYGAGAIGVVLSGLGSHGKEGAASLVQAGGLLMAQDLATAAAPGMPQAVIRAGLAAVVGTASMLARGLVEMAGPIKPWASDT